MRKKGGLVSIGYGGRRLRDLIESLRGEGVDLLVDVRLSPRSGIPGFSGAALKRSLGEAGIDYRHEPSLGNPVDNRAGFQDGARDARVRFRRILESSGRVALVWLTG